MKIESKTSEAAVPTSEYKWSIWGKAVLVLCPIILYLAAAAFTQELKPIAAAQGNQPSVLLFGEVLSVSGIRMAAIALFVISIIRLLGSPSSSTPSWMVAKPKITSA